MRKGLSFLYSNVKRTVDRAKVAVAMELPTKDEYILAAIMAVDAVEWHRKARTQNNCISEENAVSAYQMGLLA